MFQKNGYHNLFFEIILMIQLPIVPIGYFYSYLVRKMSEYAKMLKLEGEQIWQNVNRLGFI